MTEEQRELARHALGLRNGKKASYRNHFVCGPGHSDFDNWQAMTDAGQAKRHGPKALFGGDYCFVLTAAGAQAVLEPGERLDPEDFPVTRV